MPASSEKSLKAGESRSNGNRLIHDTDNPEAMAVKRVNSRTLPFSASATSSAAADPPLTALSILANSSSDTLTV